MGVDFSFNMSSKLGLSKHCASVLPTMAMTDRDYAGNSVFIAAWTLSALDRVAVL